MSGVKSLLVFPCFNPRARGGRDVGTGIQFQSTVGFNPRARGGRDAGLLLSDLLAASFQSTRPRGARQERWAGCSNLREFQSTRPRGARHLFQFQFFAFLLVSIHAPAGGATAIALAGDALRICFNPRARGGRDIGSAPSQCCYWRFNPRARGGRDYDIYGCIGWPTVSIHAPAGGAT